jgi:hypothetical protein
VAAAQPDEALARSTRPSDDGPNLAVVAAVGLVTAILAGWLVLELWRRWS